MVCPHHHHSLHQPMQPVDIATASVTNTTANPSALPQQPPIPVALLPQPCTSLTPIFPVSSPPVISVAQHGSATTQPTTLTSTISHAPLLHPQETNQDALSTASDTLLPAATIPGEHADPSVSVSLPPVPLAVQHHILRGELGHVFLCKHYPTHKYQLFHYATCKNQFFLLLARCLENLHFHNCGS